MSLARACHPERSEGSRIYGGIPRRLPRLGMTPRGLNFALVESMKRRAMVLAAAAILAAACSKEEATQKTQHAAAKVAQKVQDVFDVSAPLGKPDGPEAAQQRERER